MSSPSKFWAIWALVLYVLIQLGHLNDVAARETSCRFESFRLADRIKPTHYELLLKLHDIRQVIVEGQVKIDVSVGPLSTTCPPPSDQNMETEQNKEPVGCKKNEIVLNANSRISFSKVRYIAGDLEAIESDEIWRDSENEMASIRFPRELEDNSHGLLVIDFSVNVANSDRTGLFQSFWYDRTSKKYHVSYATQFEPVSARKAFPCFDEPSLKATFGVVIEHWHNYTALSNMLPIRAEPVDESNELIRTHFEVTPRMSTYLLAVAVGRYEYLETEINSIALRVYTPEGEKHKGQFFLDTARRAYDLLDGYFGIEQPIKKIDIIPIQHSFGAAMENWGLITFKDDQLLVDSTTSSNDLAERSIYLCHELAHFWFGNLVTMKWWDNLWLKESFAQWLGITVADQIFPEFNLNIYFVQRVLIEALRADARPTRTHPIKNSNLHTVRDICGSFDQITYNKGASVMRMMESYVGHESFKLGLRDYINKFKYQNTEESDLWNALEARSEVPVARMLHTWLNQAGFPLVSVELLDDNKLRVQQARFEEDVTLEGKQQLWLIPVDMVVVHDGRVEELKFVLSERQQDIQLPDWFDATKGHWLKLNANARGFYRVQYDARCLSLMESPVRSKQMEPVDRLLLLDDLTTLYHIGKISEQVADDIVDWYKEDDSPGVLESLVTLVSSLRYMTSGKIDRHSIFLDYFNRFDKEPMDGVQESKTKEAVLSLLVSVDYQPAIDMRANRIWKGSSR